MDSPRMALPGEHHETNIGSVERVLSAAAGVKLMLSGLARPTTFRGMLMTAAGGYLAYRGISGYCPMYDSLGAGKPMDVLGQFASREVRVCESVTIARSAEELYGFWRGFENLPRIMRHLQSVEVLDERRSRWRAEAPGGKTIAWEAMLIEDRPNELIAWQSINERHVQHQGQVGFLPAGERGTIVRVTMIYRPIGGAIGVLIAKLFRREPGQEIREDLRRFKQLMETGEVADNTSPSARDIPIEEEYEAEEEFDVASPVGARQRSNRPPRRRRSKDPQERERRGEEETDQVEEASKQSFPASDPPAF